MTISNIPTFFDAQAFCASCKAALIVSNPTEFKYPKKLQGNAACQNDWDSYVSEIKKTNSATLKSLRNKANLYAIYSQKKSSAAWELQYVVASEESPQVLQDIGF